MAATRLYTWSTYAYLSLCFWSHCDPGAEARGQSVQDALSYEDSVVCLNRGGGFLVWDARSGEYDPKLSEAFSKGSVIRVASDGRRTWGVGGKSLFEWSKVTNTWEPAARVEAGVGELAGIAVVGGTPLLLFPTRVLSPTEGRVFEVPQLQGQFDNLKKLRVTALQTTDRVLWVGTGQGEWGGHLVGLDVRTGRWVQCYDALHYVTGITVGAKGEVTVSWSMSHFGADTLIRIHRPDATPEISYPKLRDRYYQRVAYSPFDKALYGVEGQSVVAISKGRHRACSP